MSDLFTWLQSFLNLSKIAAVTVPGMVVAFALILVVGPVPCQENAKSCPFCAISPKPMQPAQGGSLSVSAPIVTFKNGPPWKTVRTKLSISTTTDFSPSDIGKTLQGDSNRFFADPITCDSANKDGKCNKFTLVIGFNPARSLGNWLESWFKPASSPLYNASLDIWIDSAALSDSPPSETTITLVGASNPAPETTASKTSDKSKLANNTVVTSTATWFKPSPAPPNSSKQPTPVTSSGAAPDRSSLLVSLESLLDPTANHLSKEQLTALENSCAGMPLYVVPGSHPPTAAPKTDDSSKLPPGSPAYQDQKTMSVDDVLSYADACHAADLTDLLYQAEC